MRNATAAGDRPQLGRERAISICYFVLVRRGKTIKLLVQSVVFGGNPAAAPRYPSHTGGGFIRPATKEDRRKLQATDKDDLPETATPWAPTTSAPPSFLKFLPVSLGMRGRRSPSYLL